MSEKLDALHNWLYSLSRDDRGVTVVEIMDELHSLRLAKPDGYGDLPADGISCQQLLERLEADGRATRNGSFWRWAPGREKSPVEKQGSLFG